jgi:hypothetical protein
MQSSLLVFAVLLLGASCSKVDNMEKRTKKMERSTDELKQTTSVMYQQIRSKDSEENREKKFELVLADETGFASRITAAGVYFKSMEFQLWNNNGRFDDFETLKSLYLDAANEFTRRMSDLYVEIDVKDMSPIKNRKSDQAFYALAAALGVNHSFQEALKKDRKEETASMYNLIKESLLRDHKHKSLLRYQQVFVTGINKEIMIELIKARVDILSAIALNNLTNKRGMSTSQKAEGILFRVTGGKLGGIHLPELYENANDSTKEDVVNTLKEAVKAKAFLEEIGVKKTLEKNVLSALKNIQLNDSDDKTIQKQEENDHYKESIRSSIQHLTGKKA